jgi:Lon protease-like protein
MPLMKKPEGTWTVLVKGQGKARLKAVVESRPYLICDAEWIDEEVEITPPNRFLLHRFTTLIHNWLQQNVVEDHQRNVIMNNIKSTQAIMECLVMCMVEDPDVRQRFLEIDNADERAHFLQRIFT